MSGLADFFLGSEGKISWKELQKLMYLQQNLNSMQREGAFTGWDYEYEPKTIYNKEGDPKGTVMAPTRMFQTVDEGFQPAVDRLRFSATKGADPYTSPGQFSTMLDAKMGMQMDRHGMRNRGYGAAGLRQGRFPQAYLPPAPDEVGGPPPSGGLPPSSGEPPLSNPPPRPPVGGPGKGTGPGYPPQQPHWLAQDGGYI